MQWIRLEHKWTCRWFGARDPPQLLLWMVVGGVDKKLQWSSCVALLGTALTLKPPTVYVCLWWACIALMCTAFVLWLIGVLLELMHFLQYGLRNVLFADTGWWINRTFRNMHEHEYFCTDEHNADGRFWDCLLLVHLETFSEKLQFMYTLWWIWDGFLNKIRLDKLCRTWLLFNLCIVFSRCTIDKLHWNHGTGRERLH